MNEYEMIFKRKSFHRFPDRGSLSQAELALVRAQIDCLKPLVPLKTEFIIVPREETTCKIGEYCILIYGERGDNYLTNVGYMGEQLDLRLAAHNIGACWYGMAKPKTERSKLDFVIMIAIGKVDETDFRKDFTKTKRKDIDKIWDGERKNIAETAKLAPSACNSQPWFVKSAAKNLEVSRVSGGIGIIPKAKLSYYNRIDMGIFLFILELCLDFEGHSFERILYPDDGDVKTALTAFYNLAE